MMRLQRWTTFFFAFVLLVFVTGAATGFESSSPTAQRLGGALLSFVSSDEGITGPATVTTRVRIGDIDGAGTDQGIWLAGLAAEPGGTPTALALTFARVSLGWFGSVWGLQLQSDLGLIPESLVPREGEGFFAGTQFARLLDISLESGKEYEVSLGYDPMSGRSSVSVLDVASGEVLLSRSLQLRPTGGPLYPAAGAGYGSGRPSFQENAPFWGVQSLDVVDALVPVGTHWSVMQRADNNASFRTADRIDRRKETAFSVSLPWDDVPGELQVALHGQDGETLVTLYEVDPHGTTPVSLAGVPAGDYRAVLQYEANGKVLEIGERAFSVGVVSLRVEESKALMHDGEGVEVWGTLVVESDGPIESVEIGMRGLLRRQRFDYDPLAQNGHVERETWPAFTIMEPAALGFDSEKAQAFGFGAVVPLPAYGQVDEATHWELRLEPFAIPPELVVERAEVSEWVGDDASVALREGYLAEEDIVRIDLAPGISVYRLQGRIPAGPIEMYLLVADRKKRGIYFDALVADQPVTSASARWPSARIGDLTEKAGAVAGINAAFFEIRDTMNPRGILIQSGEVLKTADPSNRAAVGFTYDGTPFFGSWLWNGGIRKSDESGYRKTVGLNVKEFASGIAIFQKPWTRSPGGAGLRDSVVELVVTELTELTEETEEAADDGVPEHARVVRGRVSDLRVGEPGVALPDGVVVITGFGASADYLRETYSVGDHVEIIFSFVGVTEWPRLDDWRELRSAVSGGAVLVRNGQYGGPAVTNDLARHPRTAVAASRDQSVLYWLVVDGRSLRSVGMTYREMADFLLYQGAFHALNLDGGGSSTLAIKKPGGDGVEILNIPSDGQQRYVPDGLGLFIEESPTW